MIPVLPPHLTGSSYILLYLSSCFGRCHIFLHPYVRNESHHSPGMIGIGPSYSRSQNPTVYSVAPNPSSSLGTEDESIRERNILDPSCYEILRKKTIQCVVFSNGHGG